MLGRIKNPSTINRVNLAQAVVLSAAMAAYDFYSIFINYNNHTGLRVDFLVIVFALAFFINLADLAAQRKRPLPGVDRRLIVIVAVIAAIGALNVSIFKEFNVMMEYSDWVDKGMPPKPPFLDIFR
jgi:peptidoglycan/LPS O-acetylase OafA/YrhL